MFPFISLSKAKRLFDSYMRKALRNGAGTVNAKDPPAQDEEMWRSDEDGRHFRFESESGEITAGFGGKLNGEKLNHHHKQNGGRNRTGGGKTQQRTQTAGKPSTAKTKPGSQQRQHKQTSTPTAPSATGANKLKRGFTPSSRAKHEKHRIEQYPQLTPEQYEARGIALAEQPIGGDVEGFLDNAGNIVRYRKSTNEFVVAHPDGGLFTFFRPKKDPNAGYQYFLKQKASAERSARRGKKR